MTDRILSETTIAPEYRLTSLNGEYTCIFQGDGNLVVYRQLSKAIWSTATRGFPNDLRLLQNDGSLVLYYRGKVKWGTPGGGKYPPYSLVMQDDGNLVIYNNRMQSFWSSITGPTPQNEAP
jgi:hypothetical protein